MAKTPTAGASADPAAAVGGQSTTADAPKDPREQYRDSMLQGAEGTTAANPSVSRRYKMMDRETYRATVLGVTPPTPAPAPAPPQ
jgi:hypothetical protein